MKILGQVILGLIVGAAWTALFGLMLLWYIHSPLLFVTYIGVPFLVLATLRKAYWFRLTIFLTTTAVTLYVLAQLYLPVAL